MTFIYKTKHKGDINFFKEKLFRFIENDLVMNSYSFHKNDNFLIFSAKALSDNGPLIISKFKWHIFNNGKIWLKESKDGIIVKIKYYYLSFFIISVIISWIIGMITIWLGRNEWVVFLKGFLIALLAVNFFVYKILKFRADRLIHPNIFTVLQFFENKVDAI